MRYAQVNLATFEVELVIESDTAPLVPQSVFVPVSASAPDPIAGQIYSSLNNEFVTGPTARRISHFDLMSRLGPLVLASVLAAKRVSVEVEMAWEYAVRSDFIDLDEAKTAQMLGVLVLAGIIEQQQADVILAGGSL